MKKTTVYNCSVIELPKIHKRAGERPRWLSEELGEANTPILGKETILFEIKR